LKKLKPDFLKISQIKSLKLDKKTKYYQIFLIIEISDDSSTQNDK